MTEITDDHVEWVIVGRLRLMLEEPPHKIFNVTQTYALFTAIVCWVMQRIRVNPNQVITNNDRLAAKILKKLSVQRINEEPWDIQLAVTGRFAQVGKLSVYIPAPLDFSGHTVDRLLINLRDATAHGGARNIEPFHIKSSNGVERLLAGFTFHCSERDRSDRSKKSWHGQITLLEEDMRRIGCHLAKTYCDAMRHSEAHRHDGNFGSDAAFCVQEAVA